MNVGLCEAEALAGILQKILLEEAPLDLLAGYSRERQNEWRHLLGLPTGLQARKESDIWVRTRAAQILPCLPASGQDLNLLANQLGLDPG